MAGRVTAFELDVTKLEGMADNLAQLDGDKLAEASANALNTVIKGADERARTRILSTINLTAPYVDKRMFVKLASKERLVASITAPGVNTSLGRYDALATMQVAKSPIKRLKGNPGLRIPRGLKQKAVSVEVVRGGRKLMVNETAFISPTLKNSDGAPMVFTLLPTTYKGKDGKTRHQIEARYGPAVYQLFRVARDEQLSDVETELELTLLAEAEAAIDEAFDK